jgi:hypothetical protein
LTGTAALADDVSDSVGVVGVKFSVDGAQVGIEDTTAPYSISWNASSVGNGGIYDRARSATEIQSDMNLPI